MSDAGAALARDLGMVFRVQLSPEAEPEGYAVRFAGRLKAVQLNERLRACASRRTREMSPIVFRSTPRWFTPRLAAGGAELVGVAEYLHHMTEPM
jgi:hypothetical protein